MNLSGLLQLGAAAIVAVLVPLAQAPTQSTVATPRIVPDTQCEDRPEGEDIVVCGRRDRNNDYRIPEPLREQPSSDPRNVSWAARAKDEASLQRFSDQTTGPAGYLQHNRQVDCEWRAARQEMQGKRPDCTRSVRPSEPDDSR